MRNISNVYTVWSVGRTSHSWFEWRKWVSNNFLVKGEENRLWLHLQERRQERLCAQMWRSHALTWGSLSLHSCLWSGGMADWAGGQCSPSVLPFTEYSGVLPSVMSKVRNTRNSSASYSKNSSVASRQNNRRSNYYHASHLKRKQETSWRKVKYSLLGKQHVLQ